MAVFEVETPNGTFEVDIPDGASPPKGELKPYEPSYREEVTQSLSNLFASFGIEKYTARKNAEGLVGLAEYTPFGLLTSLDDAGRAMSAGDYGGAAMSVVGAVPVVGKGAGEAVSQAERLARAKGLGFHTGMPLYHGTGTAFEAFDPARRGATTKVGPAQQGVWASLDPETANEFAEMSGKEGLYPQVYPLYHRAKKPGVIQLNGDELNHEIAATLSDAFDSGFDAVMLKNYTTPEGKTGRNVVVVRDEKQLRSPFANFDPAKIDSRDLLASLAAIPGLKVVSSAMDGEEGDNRD